MPVARMRLLFLLVGAAAGTVYPFIAVLFSDRGMQPAAFGALTGLGALVGIAVSPGWAHAGDILAGLRRALVLALAGTAACLFVLGVLPGVVAGVIAYLGFSAAMAGVNPLTEAVTVNAVRRAAGGPSGRAYGSMRLFRSLGWALAAIPAGLLLGVTGYWLGPILAGALCGLAALAALSVPDATADRPEHLRTGRGGSFRLAAERSPSLLALLPLFALAFAGAAVAGAFLPLWIVEHGGSSVDVALASSLQALAEVPGFLLAGWIASRFGLRWVYLLSCALMSASLLALIVWESIAAMLGVRMVMGIAFGGMLLTPPVAIGRLLPAWLQGTGQTMGAVAGGVAALLFGVVGGVLYQTVGPAGLFGAAAIVASTAAVLAFRLLPGPVQVRRAA